MNFEHIQFDEDYKQIIRDIQNRYDILRRKWYLTDDLSTFDEDYKQMINDIQNCYDILRIKWHSTRDRKAFDGNTDYDILLQLCYQIADEYSKIPGVIYDDQRAMEALAQQCDEFMTEYFSYYRVYFNN